MNFVEDADLPVWSFRANIKEPMTERVSFLTDVITSASGAEQRRCLRETPRRSFDVDLLLTGPERTFYDLFCSRLVARDVMVPLYWEAQLLAQPLIAGVSNRIDFDTRFREWGPGLLLIMGPTALVNEVVEIVAVDDDGLDLAEAPTKPWPRGTRIIPLRRAILEVFGDMRRITGGVATTTVRFTVVAGNDRELPDDPLDEFEGRPVFTESPNWREPLSSSFDTSFDVFDNETGIPVSFNQLGRTTSAQAHTWFLNGRERLAGFRDLIYRQRGRTKTLWVPTFTYDMQIAEPVAAGSAVIEIENIGYSYTGGPASGRDHIAITQGGVTTIHRVMVVVPLASLGRERMSLDPPIGQDLSVGGPARISFVDIARFDQDDFEITHHGGIDGLHESQSVFRTVRDVRTAPLPTHVPIPQSDKSAGFCGPDPGSCYAPDLPRIRRRVNVSWTPGMIEWTLRPGTSVYLANNPHAYAVLPWEVRGPAGAVYPIGHRFLLTGYRSEAAGIDFPAAVPYANWEAAEEVYAYEDRVPRGGTQDRVFSSSQYPAGQADGNTPIGLFDLDGAPLIVARPTGGIPDFDNGGFSIYFVGIEPGGPAALPITIYFPTPARRLEWGQEPYESYWGEHTLENGSPDPASLNACRGGRVEVTEYVDKSMPSGNVTFDSADSGPPICPSGAGELITYNVPLG